jgi:hypothetical protein
VPRRTIAQVDMLLVLAPQAEAYVTHNNVAVVPNSPGRRCWALSGSLLSMQRGCVTQTAWIAAACKLPAPIAVTLI